MLMLNGKLRGIWESGTTGTTANIEYQVCSIFGNDWNEGGRSTNVKLDQSRKLKPERRNSPHAEGEIDAGAESLSCS